MKTKLLLFVAVFAFATCFASAESLQSQYTFSETDFLTLDNGLVAAMHIDPSTASEQIQSLDAEYDLYIFPLPCLGFTALLDSNLPAVLSSNPQLNDMLQTMPAMLNEILVRDGKLLAFPISLDMYPLQLETTIAKMDAHGLSAEQFPSTILELYETANRWYLSGQLDGVNLLRTYGSPEMIVYFALQQYTLANTAYGAMPDYTEPFFKRLLEQALILSDTMSEHNAFSSDAEFLFTINHSRTSFEDENSLLIFPMTLSDVHPSSDYLVGLVAIVNPYSEHKEEAIFYLANEIEKLSTSTLLYLDSRSTPRNLSVLSEYVNQLEVENSLYEIAVHLVNGSISIEQCINSLQQ